MAKCSALSASAPALAVMQRLKDAVKPLEESIADYCSAIIFIALQKACVKALSASALSWPVMQRLKDAVKPLEESVFGLACM